MSPAGTAAVSTPAGASAVAEQTRIVLADGRRWAGALGDRGQVHLWSRILHRGRTGLVEVVPAERVSTKRLRMGSRDEAMNFILADDPKGLWELTRRYDAEGLEVFCTAATLTVPVAGNDAVGELGVAWVDIDEPENIERLRSFGHPPHMVVESAGSGGVHGFWRLAVPVEASRGEQMNRMLAEAVGGDPPCANRGRIFRVPGSRNRKHEVGGSGARCLVRFADLARPGYPAEELVEGLTDPKQPRSPRRPRSWSASPADRAIESIPPPEYFWRLGQIAVPAHGGYVRCPAHDDHHPSCFVYPDPGEGFYCYACGFGGGIFQLAAALKGIPPEELRGEAFKEVKRSVCEALGIEETTQTTERTRNDRDEN